MVILRNGRVLDPASGLDTKTDVVVKDGRIVKIGPWEGEGEVLDISGLTIAPGLVDIHSHFRDPGLTYKEDICTGAAAAAAGGYTTVVCMANTKPPVDSVDTLTDLTEREKKLPIHVLNCACVTREMKGQELTDFVKLKEAGAVGLTDDGVPIADERLLLSAMEKAKALDMAISLHEEDPALIGSAGVNAGVVSKKLGLAGASALAEQTLVARDCMLALETGVRLDIQHVSSAVTVELIRTAKRLGADVWAEVTPQHLTLTEEKVLECGALAKVNPPLRTEADRQALIEGLRDGTIDMIATDHAPHAAEEKDKGIEKAPSGMIGLETALGLCITSLVKPGRMSLTDVIEKLTVKPADFYGLEAGRLIEGGPADLVCFDENAVWKVSEKDFYSKSSNSPFIGMELTGRVMFTMCCGEIVYRTQEV